MRRLVLLVLLLCGASLACVVAAYDPRGSGCDAAHPCPGGLACVANVCGGALVLDDGGVCTTTADCGNGFLCRSGFCTGCGAEAACPLGERCSSGVCAPDCSVSLAAILHQDAGTVIIPACLYRDTLVLDHAVHVVGRVGAEIRGSDVFTSFTQDGGLFYSALSVPSYPNDSCTGDATACAKRDQVFFDGEPLVFGNLPPKPGQFALDGNRHVYLAQNPLGHSVEVSTRTRWAQVTANDVHLSHLVFRHAVSGPTTGALSNFPAARFSADHCVITQAAGACVALRFTSGLMLDHDVIGPCGGTGVRMVNVDGGGITNTAVLSANQTQMYSTGDNGPSAIYLFGLNLTVSGNEVADGGAYGIWAENAPGGNVAVENNLVHSTSGNGIKLDQMGSAVVAGNRVFYTGYGNEGPQGWGFGAGILIRDSHNVEVDHNVVAWSADGIAVLSQLDVPPWNVVYGVTVHDNVVANGDDVVGTDGWHLDLGFLSDQPLTTLWDGGIPNTGHDNFFWNATEEAEKRFGWGDNNGIVHLADFNATPGGQNDVYLSDAGLMGVLEDAGIPLVQFRGM